MSASRMTENPYLHEVGELPCRRCGKPHNSYYDPEKPRMAASWADPEDGHVYYPLSWEEMYRREVARNAEQAAGRAEAS